MVKSGCVGIEKRKNSINTVSRDDPTVSARFIYGSTTTHDGSATIHLGGAVNGHDASTIRYGASTIQASSATCTVASRPATNVHDLVVVMRQFAKLWHQISLLFNLWRSQSCHQKEKLRQNQNSHLTHPVGSVLSQVKCNVQVYQMTSSSSCKLAIWSLWTYSMKRFTQIQFLRMIFSNGTSVFIP